jgi:hypothetical protein
MISPILAGWDIGLADTPVMRDSWYYLFALLAAAMHGWLIFVTFVPS